MLLKLGVIDEDAGLIHTRVDWVCSIADPWAVAPWVFNIPAATIWWPKLPAMSLTERRDHVWHCCETPAGGAVPYDQWDDSQTDCPGCHLDRIEYLTAFGWTNPDSMNSCDEDPITVDVGVFDQMPIWPILDGNHRLAAAVLRGDDFITVQASGDWDRCLKIFVDGIDFASAYDATQ